MYRILLFNDSKWRDSFGTIILKLKLQELLPDAIVEICSYHLWQSAIELFNPHLVVLNHIQGKRNKMIAKRKGTLAGVATGGSIALLILASPVLGILGLAGSAYLGYDWFSFRARNGMRF